MFPKIKHLDDLLPFIESNKMIRVKQEDNGMTVVCYMLQDEDMFSGEHKAFERECRGITFHPDGSIAARTLHKFHNVGEREDLQPEHLDWSSVSRIMAKRDGSMVTPVLLPNGYIKFKTKKSFDTKEATLADALIQSGRMEYNWVRMVVDYGLTPTFEITSPRFPIVLLYEKDELTLLHVRENETGRYLSEEELYDLDSPFQIVQNLTETFIEGTVVSWPKLKKYAETAEGVEGVVIQFGQEMVKLKTKWYCDLHHSVTFTRWRDIARTVLADQADDLKGAFAMTGRDIEPILKVERIIKGVISAAQTAVEAHVSNGLGLGRTPKEMALAFKDHNLFGQVMRAFRGQEVNWYEWYEKNHLAEWTLEVV